MPADAYDTLGVRRDASLDEIRISYRRSVQVLQPERFASASEPIQHEAARRLSELTAAMEQIEAWRAGESSGTGGLGPVPFGGGPAEASPTAAPEAVQAQTALAPERHGAPANGAGPAAAPLEDELPEPAASAVEDEPAPEPPRASVFDVDAVPSAAEAADPDLAAAEPPLAEPPPAAAPPPHPGPAPSGPPPPEHVRWDSTEPPEAALADELARRRPRRQRTNLQRAVILVGLLAVAAVPTVLYLQSRNGSGGTPSDERVFARPGAPFAFHYPTGWRQIAARPGAALNKPTYQVELGLDRQDLIAALTYALRFDVQPDGSAVDRASGRTIPRVELQRDIDVRIEQIGRAAGMTRVDAPVKGTLGALPARIYRYRGKGANSTFYVAFQGSTEYFVNCLAGAAPARTRAACHLVTSTFSARG